MFRLPVLALVLALPASALATPVKVVEDTLVVPEGMSADAALDALDDLPALFDLYEPAVPWIPGVKIELSKVVESSGDPIVLALPVQGAAFGRTIEEEAQVTVTTRAHQCANSREGLVVDLSFDGSSWNVERRVERIAITACPRRENGTWVIDARGALHEGELPRDPELNRFEENIGAKAIQSAFLAQVPAVFDAVQKTWASQLIDDEDPQARGA